MGVNVAIVNTLKLGFFDSDNVLYSIAFGFGHIIEYANLHGKTIDYIDLNKINWKKFRNMIKNYDLVGYSILSPNYNTGIKAISINKEVNKNVTIVVGGVDVSINPDKYMKNKDIDYVVTGEGEISFLKIIQSKENHDEKIEKLVHGEKIENLDDLGFINRDLFPEKRVFDPSFENPAFTIFSSRTCKYNCNFCQPVPKIIFGKKSRYRSPEHVVKELNYLKSEYGLKSFQIMDENMLQNREYLLEFIECCKSANFKADFLMLGRSDNIIQNEDLIKELYDIGLRAISIGFESGSDKMLKYLNKGTTVEKNQKAVKIIKKHKIHIIGNFMFGFLNETKYDMKLTEKFIKKNDIDVLSISTFQPLPGTSLTTQYKKEGLLYEPDTVNFLSFYKPKIKGVNYFYVVWFIFKLQFKYQKYQFSHNKYSRSTIYMFKVMEFYKLIYYFFMIIIYYIWFYFKKK
ncbi:MAG: B12-binding domain-containing radical SAM protein [Methanobrevibacter sp. CfCl-M3]